MSALKGQESRSYVRRKIAPAVTLLVLFAPGSGVEAKRSVEGAAEISVDSGPEQRISRQSLVEIEDAVFREFDRRPCFSVVMTSVDGSSSIGTPLVSLKVVVSRIEETLEHRVGLAQSVDPDAPPGSEPPRRASARIEGEVICMSGTDERQLASKRFEVSATYASQPGFGGDPVAEARAEASSRAAGRIVAFACSPRVRRAALGTR